MSTSYAKHYSGYHAMTDIAPILARLSDWTPETATKELESRRDEYSIRAERMSHRVHSHYEYCDVCKSWAKEESENQKEAGFYALLAAHICDLERERDDARAKALNDACEALLGLAFVHRRNNHHSCAAATDACRIAVESLQSPSPGAAVEVRKAASLTVCKCCNDTHKMDVEDRGPWPCTSCPTPCERCRDAAYCRDTPCQCACHKKDKFGYYAETHKKSPAEERGEK